MADGLSSETWDRLVRSAPLWGDPRFGHPTKLHDSTCNFEEGNCTCRTPVDQLAVGTLVVVLKTEGEASLISIVGCLPVWVESLAVEHTKIPIGESTLPGSVPADYLEWLGTGCGRPSKRVRTAPKGGGLVLVRADKKEPAEPWRWVGHVHQQNELCLLLVDPMTPLDRIFGRDHGEGSSHSSWRKGTSEPVESQSCRVK